MRLRTLPLSLSGVVCGGWLGYSYSDCNPWVLLWLALTAFSLQVLSNLSNELGDYRSGVDSEDRQGPAYGLARGLAERQLHRAVVGAAVASAVFGLAMLLTSFRFSIFNFQFFLLLALGAAAIWAATHYTLGRNPYGYRGLGDVFVFLFFGLVSVMGSFFVVAHRVELYMLFPAVGIGLLSVAVLNVNNIRDMATDQGLRITTPLRIGLRRARIYHTALVALGWMAMAVSYNGNRLGAWLMLCTLPLFVLHILGVWRREGRRLDPMLPLLVMSTFLLSIIYTFGMAYGI